MQPFVYLCHVADSRQGFEGLWPARVTVLLRSKRFSAGPAPFTVAESAESSRPTVKYEAFRFAFGRTLFIQLQPHGNIRAYNFTLYPTDIQTTTPRQYRAELQRRRPHVSRSSSARLRREAPAERHSPQGALQARPVRRRRH